MRNAPYAKKRKKKEVKPIRAHTPQGLRQKKLPVEYPRSEWGGGKDSIEDFVRFASNAIKNSHVALFPNISTNF